MAEIWLAEQEMAGGLQRQLVIKQILPHMARDKQFTEMFLDEARTVLRLTHPNIAQVYELGETDGKYFISMEYVDGLDLSDLITKSAERGQPIPVELAVRIVADMLQGLDFAHNLQDDLDKTPMGLVHRDVTPHNILVSNDGVVKLLDFGVAKAKANSSKTQTGAVKGKYAYMAPEQIESKDLDRRVDVFAAGIVLFEVLTGTRPFGDDLAAINAILSQPMPDPRQYRPDVPQSLVNILEVAMAKNRDERYASAEAMMRDLEDFLRASGAFVGQRDIAAFVRSLRGLAPSVTTSIPTGQGPRARITRQESMVSGPATGPNQRPNNFTAEISTLAPTPRGGSGKTLIALGLVVVAIFGAIAVIAGLIIFGVDEDKDKDKPVAVKNNTSKPPKDPKKPDPKPDTKPDPKPDTKPDPKPDTKPDDKPPAARVAHYPPGFHNPVGKLVEIHTDPKQVDFFYNGQYLGHSPLKAALPDGEYTLILKYEGKEQPLTFKVEGKPQVIRPKLQ
jgi:serine/threonine-protein kinase